MKYFDKDFFKFFWGFVAIVVISLVVIMVGKKYEERNNEKATIFSDNISTVD